MLRCQRANTIRLDNDLLERLKQAHAMGLPRQLLDNALSLASTLEDEEIGRGLTLGK